MQVVIDIPDEVYSGIVNHFDTFSCETRKWGVEAIKNGTVLHEPHGDLIDRRTLDMSQAVDGDRRLGIAPLWIANRIVENADTIIPATKGADT